MGRNTFKGGIHPYDGKDLSKDKPIESFKPGKLLYYPLSQHIGAPAKAIVNKDDRVLRGQMIAEAGGFVSAPIYASVSGVIKGIEKHRVVSGDMVDCIVLENDDKYEEAEPINTAKLEDMSRDDIIDVIGKAGIIGMGGAGFPTHVKLSPKDSDAIEYVIVNCAECEPYLTSDYRKMLEEPDKLIKGLSIEVSLFKNAKGILAVEDNKMDCVELLTEKAKEYSNIEVLPLKTKYPQGSERQLIYACTKRKINSKMLPADAGCVVNNVDTVISIYKAVVEGKPLMDRIVTVTGDAINNPKNFEVPVGTIYSELLEAAGGFKTEPKKVISGGPMMGMALFTLDVPVTKASSALLCMTKDDVSELKQTQCINCGRCAQVCPSRLLPGFIADYADAYDEEMFLKYGGLECVECGSCSYVCPARKHLAQSIKSMRKIQLAKKKK